ncbi:CyP450 monooxygenase [Polyporus arcularius HHB13444]|uniref:CyP450 monooxygenase n=1 Tax=Polyporus arcularius HHB13444 TaxID=1314778 RepID=A0A5C3P833_9APHY|nr:CyP450 monooxygenase [Polyporus arcularius HHB13444]
MSTIWLLPLITVVAFLFLRRLQRRSSLPLPPGPRRLPILGNALDVPTKDIPGAFRAMSEKYGDVVYLDVVGQPMILLGSHEAATDLLEKRSANYSDRTPSPMVEIAGFSWALTLQGYGPWWRRHRRAIHQFFNPNAILGYAPSQRLEAHRFALRLLDTPGDFLHHIRHFFGSSIMRISYGIEVDEDPVDYLTMAEDTLAIFSSVFVPGKFLVETFPVLRFVPAWMPGAQFKRDGKEWVKTVYKLVELPWKCTMDAVNRGVAPPSMASGLMENIAGLSAKEAAQEEEVARNATAVAYAGGADTTLSTVQTFFLAMASYPEVQAKAQAELDAVVGPSRLPEYSDQDSLPYINALVKELLRWRSVVPTGVPHRSIEDDEYKGYFIPKGSIVIPNIWAYSRDPTIYPDPETFMPERWLKDGRLNPDVRDSETIAFGYGRRSCPGKHFAMSSLYMIVSTVLHMLSIKAPTDPEGKPIPLSGRMTQGVIAYPEPFECVIEPRSSAAEALIRATAVEF